MLKEWANDLAARPQREKSTAEGLILFVLVAAMMYCCPAFLLPCCYCCIDTRDYTNFLKFENRFPYLKKSRMK